MFTTAKDYKKEFGSLGTKIIFAIERRNGRSANYTGEITEGLSKYFCYVFGEEPCELIILHGDPDTETLSSQTVSQRMLNSSYYRQTFYNQEV